MTEEPTCVQGVTFTKDQLILQMEVPYEEFEKIADFEIDTFMEWHQRKLIFRLRPFLAQIGEQKFSYHAKYPKDWWEAFKEKWFPLWLKGRYPVQYTNIDIEVPRYDAVCPHVDVPKDDKIHWDWLMSQGLQPEVEEHEEQTVNS